VCRKIKKPHSGAFLLSGQLNPKKESDPRPQWCDLVAGERSSRRSSTAELFSCAKTAKQEVYIMPRTPITSKLVCLDPTLRNAIISHVLCDARLAGRVAVYSPPNEPAEGEAALKRALQGVTTVILGVTGTLTDRGVLSIVAGARVQNTVLIVDDKQLEERSRTLFWDLLVRIHRSEKFSVVCGVRPMIDRLFRGAEVLRTPSIDVCGSKIANFVCSILDDV
jgi:hypothetical protein